MVERRRMPVAAFVGIALLAQGCAQIKGSFRVDESIGFGNTTAEIGSCTSESNGGNIGSIKPINLTCYKIPGAGENETAYNAVVKCSKDAKSSVAGSSEERSCRVLRNELQGVILLRSNAICDQHKGDILSQAALTNLTLGVGSTATSALGAVLAGVHAKTNLAATTAFLTGSQSLLNQEFYQKQFAGTIITAINTNRANKKTEIDQKRPQTIAAYSIDDALLDAQEYHYRCSFYSGVSQVTKAVERQDQTSRAKLIERIDALRSELEKTEKTTGISDSDKTRMKAALTREIEGLQAIIKATVD